MQIVGEGLVHLSPLHSKQAPVQFHPLCLPSQDASHPVFMRKRIIFSKDSVAGRCVIVCGINIPHSYFQSHSSDDTSLPSHV
ncbi:hypothetical protein TNIN_437861 [Trichonephila inaurata madagascariensis]|uniref:Uncharacterized protein n=1 Tax=Trichonephila inaurata madagascariensis TaxID=2747483 RepID=A0A8X6MEB6_9ARAC|nr:hypothetical protein TNIN_437861 [Trichonephila inaurata madagascariensis]